MRKSLRRTLVAVVSVGLTWTGAAEAATPDPLPISPGGAEEFLSTHTACPTFSWTSAEGATGYEVVVYARPVVAAPPGQSPPVIVLFWTRAQASSA